MSSCYSEAADLIAKHEGLTEEERMDLCLDSESLLDSVVSIAENLENELAKARKALLMLNDFLWYETVPVSEKLKIVKTLKDNCCDVDEGWEEHCD